MLRDEYFRRLVDGAHVELYLSANDGARLYWPWRMHPPSEANDRYRNACEKYIIDSDISDPRVTTEECYHAGEKYDAEIVALVDYMPFDTYREEINKDKEPEKWEAFVELTNQYPNAYEATLDSLKEGLMMYTERNFDGELLVPLQKPWVQCWEELGEPTEHLLGIGGLKDARDTERLKAARELRDAVGPDVWIHGFGWGVNGLAEAIRDEPGLLDSVDYSTPMQQAATDDCTPGDERMSVAAMGAAQRLVRDLREVSEFPDHKQTTQVTL